MERRNNGQVMALIALLIGVVALSVGFASYANTLTIKSSAEVKGNADTFNVDFSTKSDSIVAGTVAPTLSETVDNFTATNATIDNSVAAAAVLKDLHATFTDPGQSVTYSLYAFNSSDYDAYLKSVSFSEVSTGKTKVCTASTGTTGATQSLVDAACEGISLSIKVGTSDFSTSDTSITSHKLAKNTGEVVEVTISYDDSADVADGDFTVSFGDIVLTYNSAD